MNRISNMSPLRHFSVNLVPLTILIAILAIVVVQCQEVQEKSFSTSVAGMEQLLITEKLMIDTIDKYADELQAKVDSLKKLIIDLREENQKGVQNPEKYLYNPLNGYSLIRRMHYDWYNIEKYLGKPTGEAYIEILQSYRPEMPTAKDIAEASQAIVRLQMTYDMQAEDMSKGILFGKQYETKLKPIDQYYIGKYLYDIEGYYHAAYWMYNAIQSYESTNYAKILDFGSETIHALYAENLLKQNRPKDALATINTACNLRPDDVVLKNRKEEIEQLAESYKGPPTEYSKTIPTTYELGCRGAFANKPSRMHCVYNTTTSAFLRLAPLKMEIIHLDPYMVIYHDVMSDNEIKELQTMAKPNLKRATVYSQSEARSQVVERRTSKFSWFQDNTSNTTLRINQRIKDMTGFDIQGSEMIQVMNYGLGGHYDTHYDFFNVSDTAEVVRLQGDRISTVLFYMTDVEQGGATVFPNIQTALFPQKGSAVVWYNLNNELKGDWKTLHAACPVIVGSKWVCNKWIRAKAQVFTRPCYI
ncbi:prolyl 4-hydroxylase subunit alpha-2-like [Haematobia irritans]|uniref:prolyl 4-hydroxylase subunit alpha-2-like n=1 Tax=Haematobia irritans TaxID=7368 RepID=UPI003F500D81